MSVSEDVLSSINTFTVNFGIDRSKWVNSTASRARSIITKISNISSLAPIVLFVLYLLGLLPLLYVHIALVIFLFSFTASQVMHLVDRERNRRYRRSVVGIIDDSLRNRGLLLTTESRRSLINRPKKPIIVIHESGVCLKGRVDVYETTLDFNFTQTSETVSNDKALEIIDKRVDLITRNYIKEHGEFSNLENEIMFRELTRNSLRQNL